MSATDAGVHTLRIGVRVDGGVDEMVNNAGTVATGAVRAALLEILQYACHVVDTPEGRTTG